jgi:catechol 2,3-dioxygenase-like lactoylglutathione lyase family enzyme
MKIETLDHVALWVDERDALAETLSAEFGMHVIDRTDAFTLIGGDARLGKLTLFEAEGPREPGVLGEIGIAVPGAQEAESVRGPGGVPLSRLPGANGVADLAHVAFRVPDPAGTRAALLELGFGRGDGDGVRVAGAKIVLERGEPLATERPLLNHLGLRVESADEHIEEARRRQLEIADVIDGPNTYSLFIWGPDGIKLEYVEHKPTFSLV